MNVSDEYRKLTIEESKKISFDILCNVADFCEKNNIRYYLACGTLLGAIRHKGYIPWDDDIDIMMPRPDFNRFIKEYIDSKYKVKDPKDGMYFFGKVYDISTLSLENKIDYDLFKPIGIGIDIFPLDGFINDENKLDKTRKRNNFLESLLSISKQPIFYKKNVIKVFYRLVTRLFGSKNIVKLITLNCSKYDYDESDYVVRFKNTINGFTGLLPKNVYNPIKKEFEGKLFYVPERYDIWLSAFFGEDYMKLPPIEKRLVHNRNNYIKNN